MTTKELILICAGGVKGYVDVGEKDTLEDVRYQIKEELDDDLIVPNFAFQIGDIRVSQRQEKKKLAWQILNKVVSLQPKRSRPLEEDVDNVQSTVPKKQKRASEAIKAEEQLVSKDSKPLPCEKPTAEAAVVKNANSSQNETYDASSAMSDKTDAWKSSKGFVAATAKTNAILNGSDNVGTSDRSRDENLLTPQGKVFCTAQTVEEEKEKPQSSLATSDTKHNTGGADGDLEDDLGAYKQQKKKGEAKKKKKKKSSKSRRRSKGYLDDDNDKIHASVDHQKSDDDIPRNGKRKADYYKAKKKFEQHRDDVLAHIPRHVKEGFREIGFLKFGKTFFPVLQLSPFDVEPGKVRDLWMTMFEHCRMKKRPMTILIYWYGITWKNRSDAFSFVPKNIVHSYEDGVSKGYNILPPKIQKKRQSGKILSSMEMWHLNGLAQLEEELKRPKEDRIKWMTQFSEEYEDLSGDYASDEDNLLEEEIIEKEPETKPKKQLKKKLKKSKAKEENDPASMDIGDNQKVADSTAGSVPKKKRGRKKKAENDSVAVDIEDKQSIAEAPVVPETKKKKTKKKKKEKEGADPPPMDVEDSQKAADNNVISEDPKAITDRDNIEFKAAIEDDVISDVDKDDENFSENNDSDQDLGAKPKKKRKMKENADGVPPKKKGKLKKKGGTADEQEKATLKKGRESAKKKNKRKSESEVDPYEQEQQIFEKCENIFVPLMRSLEKANESGNIDDVRNHLEGLRDNLHIISPPFIREYALGQLVKDTKKAHAGDVGIKRLCKELSGNMKTIYHEKDSSVPINFTPKKKKIKMDADENGEAPITQETVKEEEELQQLEPAIKEEQVTSQDSSNELDDKLSETKILEQKLKVEEVERISKPVPEQVAQTPKAEPAKPRRQNFSLSKLMYEKPKQTPTTREKRPAQELNSTVRHTPKTQAPSWLTKQVITGDISPHKEERAFAMEYFLDCAGHFSSPRVDGDAIARALEMAVYEWSEKYSVGDWSSEKYWEKVHDVVGAIVGKNSTGSIVQQIINGDFATAYDVVCLSRKVLRDSFDSS